MTGSASADTRLRRLLVLKHVEAEHPGVFGSMMEEDGISIEAIEIHAGESIPPLDRYDALWVMGGPMDVWEEDRYPWLRAEKAAIREAVVERNMPFMGFCLGHQLLADALGGKVGPASRREIGMMDVHLERGAASAALFAGVPPRFKVLQWHSAEVGKVPAGARILAFSPACRVQALQVGERAFGIQFHCELDKEMFEQWRAIPEYDEVLRKTLGRDGTRQFRRALHECLPELHAYARRIYDNWKRL